MEAKARHPANPYHPAWSAFARRRRKIATIKPLASLAYRDFRLLFFTQPLIGLGSGMRNIGNAFQVYQLTGDAVLLGLTFLFQGIPALLMGFVGGSLADLFDRRRLLQIVVTLEALLVLLLAGLTVTGEIQVWHIYTVTFLCALLDSTTNPAQQAMISNLVPPTHLMNAMALRSTTGQAAMMLGPLLGGIAIDTLGAAFVYAASALLLLPAFVMLTMLHARPERSVTKPRLSWTFLFDGLRFTLKTPALLALVLLDTVTMVLGFYPAMMPVFARDVLQVGASGLGLLLAAAPFGAMLGFVGILLLGNIKRKGVVILAVTLAHAVVLYAFSQATSLPLAVVLIAVLGLLDSISMTVRSTSFSELAPDEVRGRVMSVLYISAVSANSLGGAYLGFATAALGPRDALGTGAIVAGVFTLLVAVFWKKVRQM